jgi:hypothetical protein
VNANVSSGDPRLSRLSRRRSACRFPKIHIGLCIHDQWTFPNRNFCRGAATGFGMRPFDPREASAVNRLSKMRHGA